MSGNMTSSPMDIPVKIEKPVLEHPPAEEKWLCCWKIIQGKREGEYCAKSAKYLGSSLGKIWGKEIQGRFCKRHFLLLCKGKDKEASQRQTEGDSVMEEGYVFIKHAGSIPFQPPTDVEPPNKARKTNIEEKDRKANQERLEFSHTFEEKAPYGQSVPLLQPPCEETSSDDEDERVLPYEESSSSSSSEDEEMEQINLRKRPWAAPTPILF